MGTNPATLGRVEYLSVSPFHNMRYTRTRCTALTPTPCEVLETLGCLFARIIKLLGVLHPLLANILGESSYAFRPVLEKCWKGLALPLHCT